MGYDHSMNLTARLKEGVTEEQVVEALEPLRAEMGWTREQMLEGGGLDGDSEIHWEHVGNNERLTLSLYTAGEVTHNHVDVVHACAENLAELLEPNYIELKDLSTADVANAIERIWVGDEEELKEAQRKQARFDVMDALREGGYNEEEIKAANAFLQELNLPDAEQVRDHPRG